VTISKVIVREINARRPTIMGKVVSQRYRLEFQAGQFPVWVADVDVGGERVFRDVPIKGGTDGTVRYADRGQTVALSRNSLGRFDIIGPGDRLIGTTVVKDYVVSTGADAGTGVDFGFTSAAEPYSFYRGPATLATNHGDFTFTLVGVGNDTLDRSAGSWVDDAFVAGLYIFISGPGNNTGVFGPIVAPVTASRLLFGGDVFVNEVTSAAVVGHTSRWADGQHGYPKIGIFNPQGTEV